jgi:hypothetical protein
MAGTVVADTLQADSTSTLVLKNGVANTPPTIQDSAGTQIGTFCRAWVNFNGTGTVAIRASFNVTSITDNGTGDYTVNFTNALPDVNYAFTGTLAAGSASTVVCVAESSNTTRTASLFRVYTSQQGAILIDAPAVMISVFR